MNKSHDCLHVGVAPGKSSTELPRGGGFGEEPVQAIFA